MLTEKKYLPGQSAISGQILLETLLALMLFTVLGTAALHLTYQTLKSISLSLQLFLENERAANWTREELILRNCQLRNNAAENERTLICIGNGQQTKQLNIILEEK